MAIFNSQTLLIIACAIAYAIGISHIGFYVSTFFSMFVLYLGFEGWKPGRLPVGILFSAGLCIIFYGSFSLLSIYLPDGILF